MNARISVDSPLARALLISVAILAAAVAIAVATGDASGKAGRVKSAVICSKLKVTPGVREALRQAYAAAREVDPSSTGTIYYGRCSAKSYALASFDLAASADAEVISRNLDGPDVYQLVGGRWLQNEITDGVVACQESLPLELLQTWRVECSEFIDGKEYQVFPAVNVHGGQNARCGKILFEARSNNGLARVSAHRLSCKQAKSVIRGWYKDKLRPARGPAGWKCSRTQIAVGHKRTRHACARKGKRLIFE